MAGFPELWGLILAYALGCFATGYYYVRWRTGTDVRTLGSGNIGARNVSRVLGKSGFFVTLLGDLAKGALAVWGAQTAVLSVTGTLLAMLAVVAGHNWPAQLGFRGGKGVATSLGALLMFDFRWAVILGMIFLAAWTLLRRFTLCGLMAYALAPWAVLFWEGASVRWTGLLAVSALVLLAHRDNLREELGRRNRAGPL